MPTLRNEAERRDLVERLGRLRPESTAQWGRFNAARMMCHLADALEEAQGRRAVPRSGPALLRHFPMKHLAIHVIPMPRGAKAPRELLAEEPGDFEANRRRVVEGIEQIAARPAGRGPDHFLFGKMSNDQWNCLQWKHIDHHLRQFKC
ncbi:MAG TPA: DUF1569 domain-containing protein [Acidobacteriaceae bacterium]|nr:DUF1569 domain-containing protein [Acidobacteriaceae bacterium]